VEREGRGKGKGRKGKGVGRGDEVEGGIWPTQNFEVAPHMLHRHPHKWAGPYRDLFV